MILNNRDICQMNQMLESFKKEISYISYTSSPYISDKTKLIINISSYSLIANKWHSQLL